MRRTKYLYTIFIFDAKGPIFGLVQQNGAGTVESKFVSWIHVDRARQASPSKSERPASDLSPAVRMLGTALRVAFIVCLLVVTVRVSMPQNETIWTAYDTPADLVRLVLGFGVCLWLAFQLFTAPKDAHGYRMWTYFGLLGVPFAILCLIASW